MGKDKFKEFRSQVSDTWKKFQPIKSSKDSTANNPIPKDQSLSSNGISRISQISKSAFVTGISQSISKIHPPKVKIDPWSVFWIVLATIVGGTGVASYLLLIAVPPTPNCQGIAPLSSDSERLYCANVGAETREIPKLRAAVNLVKDWTESHPIYGESQRMLTTWSQDLLKIGGKQLNDGQIEQAISTLKIVPPSSPSYAKTQELIAKYADQSQESKSIDVKFEQSIKRGDWNAAFALLQSVQRMRGTYWNSHKHQEMSQKLAKEQDAWDKLQEAKDALLGNEFSSYTVGAKHEGVAVASGNKKGKEKLPEPALPNDPKPILKAMEIANIIDPKTYVYQQGQVLRSTWSQQLVRLSIDKYRNQKFDEAILIAKKVPQDVAFYAEAQDWVKLNQAHVVADNGQILSLVDAVTQVKKIPKNSSIYTLAKEQQTNWQGLLKHQAQLQWAKMIGSIQQPATLALAIDTAKQIPAIGAEKQVVQTEINNWNRQLEAVDNRSILAKANQIVANGESLSNLRAAVQIAGKITRDRPMGEKITGVVGGWTRKIQTIEDQPIIEAANQLARQGRISQAIEVGSRIAPGRALYGTIQSDIRAWYLELQAQAKEKQVPIKEEAAPTTAQ